MKLETSDLVGYIKERHRQAVNKLRPKPVLGILVAGDEASSASFIRAKRRYAEDIGVQMIVQTVKSAAELLARIEQWNGDTTISGIVVQLPLPTDFKTDQIINQIATAKDIDGLKPDSPYDAATAKAIMWVLASQNLNIKESVVCVVGQGRLVGKPVSAMLEASGAQVIRCDINTADLAAQTLKADVVVSGVGEPGLIKRDILKAGAIVIDAATAEAGSKLAGDATPELYDDPNIRVTSVPGGVGPVTVAALFDNLMLATEH